MRVFLCAVALFFSSFLVAQNSGTSTGNWFMYNGSHKVSEKWAIKTMAHFRYYEFANNFQQEIYRLGINYTFNKKLNVTLGYSYVTTDVIFGDPSATLFENRIYEDVNYIQFFKKLKIRHRFRLEHRFITENTSKKTSQWFRYDLNLNYPITKSWSVYAFNEIFFNMDVQKRFVQNWTGFGFLHQINNALKLNIGYQEIKLPNETQERVLLGLILNTK